MGKRMRAVRERIGEQAYAPAEAFALLKDLPRVKFRESVDVSVRLGIDPKKSDQAVRGASNLPHGLGKERRVAVFARGEKAQAAEDAGADVVGMDELAERVRKGDVAFDAVIASPEAMPTVGRLGQILGPRGLMPNPRLGTVTDNVAAAVKNVKAGQVRFRADKGGVVHSSIGNIEFDVSQLRENFESFIDDLVKAKPASAKGVYLKSVTVSSTMGPGLRIDTGALNV